MIRLVSLLLLVKNFFRFGILISNIFVNVYELGKHIFRRRLRHFHFSLRWNYAVRKIFNRAMILYHIIFFIITVCVLALCYMNAGEIFDINYFYYVIGTYVFVYYFALSIMMNWYQINRQNRRNTPDIEPIGNNVPDIFIPTRLEAGDKVINTVEDLYDI